MGGKRREVKKIEKVQARRVTFAKRRKGLLKKAMELSVLCEADVGLIIFSATEKLFEYSNTSMKMILKKYYESISESLNKQQLYIEKYLKRRRMSTLTPYLTIGSCKGEDENEDLRIVRHEMESVKYTLSHMDGENLQGTNIEELQELEQKLEVGLHQIRAEKGNKIEEETNRLDLEISKFKNNSRVEVLMIEPLGTRDYHQSSEAIHDSFTLMSQHEAIIQPNDVSDISVQLRLSL